jgi:hypothetical protein
MKYGPGDWNRESRIRCRRQPCLDSAFSKEAGGRGGWSWNQGEGVEKSQNHGDGWGEGKGGGIRVRGVWTVAKDVSWGNRNLALVL